MTLRISGLSKTYKSKRVLWEANGVFDHGLTLLTGPSGAGKSTLLRILATAETADQGRVTWNGQPFPRVRRTFRKTLGYAPQSVDFPPDLTGRELGQHIAALKGLDRRMADDQFLWLAERLNLHAEISNPIGSYSGGMRRRLTVAQSLLGSPEAVVLDEPTAELDAHNSRAVHALIKEQAKSAVVVMTTHLAEQLRSTAAQELVVADTQIKTVLLS